MTIYRSLPCNGKFTSRKYRRLYQKSRDSEIRGRQTRSFSEQWKRYPNCKNVLDLRTGAKTHNLLFPRGYDPTYSAPHSWEDIPPIKG